MLCERLFHPGAADIFARPTAMTAALNWHNGRRAGTLRSNPGRSPDRERS